MKIILLILLSLITFNPLFSQDFDGQDFDDQSEKYWLENLSGTYAKGNKNQLIIIKDSLGFFTYELNLRRNKVSETGDLSISESSYFSKAEWIKSFWSSVYSTKEDPYSVVTHFWFEYNYINEKRVVQLYWKPSGSNQPKKMIKLTATKAKKH